MLPHAALSRENAISLRFFGRHAWSGPQRHHRRTGAGCAMEDWEQAVKAVAAFAKDATGRHLSIETITAIMRAVQNAAAPEAATMVPAPNWNGTGLQPLRCFRKYRDTINPLKKSYSLIGAWPFIIDTFYLNSLNTDFGQKHFFIPYNSSSR